ncbi:MAG: type II toxin-antitoxin system ParD family antitoxin [Blastocatellia bacterium]|nr:type II toxin-antitoxin system ParD family antitoxin [Blastocatellia bacterium]
MNVSLTPELEKLVNDEVASGRYKSAGEVVREGLRLLEIRQKQFETLRSDIQAGLNSGESTPLDVEAIKAEGRRRLARKRRKSR